MKYAKKKLIWLLTFVTLLLSLSVTAQAASTSLNKRKLTLKPKQSYTLVLKNNRKSVKWTTSNKKVVSVKKLRDKNKVKLTAKKNGTAVITAKVGRKKYTCKVTVKLPSKKCTFTVSKKSLTVTDTAKLNITWSYPYEGTLYYHIADKNIASCSWGPWTDKAGTKTYLKIKALKNGTTTITITNSADSRALKVKLTVTGKGGVYSSSNANSSQVTKYGTVSGNVTYHYNKYRGYVADTTARVILVPSNGSAKNFIAGDYNVFRLLSSNIEKLRRNNIYAAIVDGMGNYRIDHVPAGEYRTVIISSNSTSDIWFNVSDPQTYYDSISVWFRTYLNDRTASALGESVSFYRAVIGTTTVYENYNTTLSHAFTYTYI